MPIVLKIQAISGIKKVIRIFVIKLSLPAYFPYLTLIHHPSFERILESEETDCYKVSLKNYDTS